MTEMNDLSFAAVCKGQYAEGYNDALTTVADWIQTQRNDMPAHGWEFAAVIRAHLNLGILRAPELSDRQYLEKIASQVIARDNSKPAAATDSPEAWTPLGNIEAAVVQIGAGAVESVCPALIDDVGGGV